MLALSHPRYHLCRDSVIIKERLEPRKLHGVTLDEDEINPLGGIIKQLRSPRDPLVIPSRRNNRTIEGSQRLKRVDHLFARRKIGLTCLLQNFSGQRVIWINEHDWCALCRLTLIIRRMARMFEIYSERP